MAVVVVCDEEDFQCFLSAHRTHFFIRSFTCSRVEFDQAVCFPLKKTQLFSQTIVSAQPTTIRTLTGPDLVIFSYIIFCPIGRPAFDDVFHSSIKAFPFSSTIPSTSPKFMRLGKQSENTSIFGRRLTLKHPSFLQSQRSGLYPAGFVNLLSSPLCLLEKTLHKNLLGFSHSIRLPALVAALILFLDAKTLPFQRGNR